MKPQHLDDNSRHYEGCSLAPGCGRGPDRASTRARDTREFWIGRRSSACFSQRSTAAAAVAVLAISIAGCARKEPAPGEATSAAALNASPQIANFAVYAQNSATLRDRAVLTGGDIGVHVAGTGPFLVSGYELALVANVQVDTTHNTIANRVLLQGAKVGDVQANTLTVQNGGT